MRCQALLCCFLDVFNIQMKPQTMQAKVKNVKKGIKSTPHKRGVARCPGSWVHYVMKQSPDVNLLPVKSGMYRVRCDVKTEQVAQKAKPGQQAKTRQKTTITMTLRSCECNFK